MPQMNGNHERGIWLWRRHNCASQAIAADMNGVERRFLKTARGYLDDFITRSHGGVKEVPWPDVWQPHVEFPASSRNARSSSNPRTYWISDPSRSSRGNRIRWSGSRSLLRCRAAPLPRVSRVRLKLLLTQPSSLSALPSYRHGLYG